MTQPQFELVYGSLKALRTSISQQKALVSLLNDQTPDQDQYTSLRIQLILPSDYNPHSFDLLAYQYILGSALKLLDPTPLIEARYFKHKDHSLDLAWQSSEWSLSITVANSHSVSTAQLSINGQKSIHLTEMIEPQSISAHLAQHYLKAIALSERAQRFGVATQSPDAVIHESVLIHPSVEVSGEVTIGANTRIWHFSKLLGPVKIGEDCSFGQNVVIEKGVEIGRNVKVQNNVSIYAGVVLEDDVFCGPSMVFTNVGTPRSHYPRRNAYSVTRIGKGASIGANATIVCGHSLGRYAFVGAGAVVTKNVPDFALVYGNPARIHGWACYCGVRLKFNKTDPNSDLEFAKCEECSRQYELKQGKVTALSPLDSSFLPPK